MSNLLLELETKVVCEALSSTRQNYFLDFSCRVFVAERFAKVQKNCKATKVLVTLYDKGPGDYNIKASNLCSLEKLVASRPG